MSGSTLINGIGAILVAVLTAALLPLLNIDFGGDLNGAICGIAGGVFFIWIQNRKPVNK